MNRREKRGTLWLVIGGLLISAALLLSAYNLYDAKRAEESVISAAQKLRGEVKQENGESEQTELNLPDYILFPEMEMPIVEIDGESYIGFLDVPALELSLPVMGGEWTDAKMKKAPCLYEGSAYMKNMVIVGHNYRSHFSKLKTLEMGTEIVFTDAEGNCFEYTLEWVEIIEETDVEAMSAGSEEWDLTLFTCTYGGKERYTLRCVEKPADSLK